MATAMCFLFYHTTLYSLVGQTDCPIVGPILTKYDAGSQCHSDEKLQHGYKRLSVYYVCMATSANNQKLTQGYICLKLLTCSSMKTVCQREPTATWQLNHPSHSTANCAAHSSWRHNINTIKLRLVQNKSHKSRTVKHVKWKKSNYGLMLQ